MRRITLCLLFLSLVVPFASGQGSQTGTLIGTVTAGGSALPGVTVTIESQALQGKRTTTSGANGDYAFRFLPPGSYTVTFELQGMKKAVQTTNVSLGATTKTDAPMEVTSRTETVNVSGRAENATLEDSAVHGADYDAKLVQSLPIGRNIDQIATLAPAVSVNTASGVGTISISGGFSYDNVFLVDGVDIDDNLFAQSTNGLVIEEAVQETQVLTSGISSEYGRFSGGVVNAITKSGGNEYHGSFRTDFSNRSWTERTPFEVENGVDHTYKLNEVYTGTLGGKVVADRLWFFTAGRYFNTSTQQSLPLTADSYQQTDTETRFQGKLTLNINDSHSLSGAYTHSVETLLQPALVGLTVEDTGLVKPQFPSKLYVGTYHGVLTPSLFVTLQYSEKKTNFNGFGGTSTNIQDSPFLSYFATPFVHFGQPYFDATDPEVRNNKQWAGSVSYYLTSAKLGSHDLKIGGEIFSDIHAGGNSQSPTNFVFYSDYLTDASGNPVYDSTHHLIPTFDPKYTFIDNYLALRGAETNIKTSAIYLNDSWRINNHLSANLGVRYQKVKGDGPGGSVVADSSKWVPRLGLAYDVKGDGQLRLSGTYAQYAGGYNDAQFSRTTNVGNPNLIQSFYTGPVGQGYDFAPGFDPNNYTIFGGNFPTANVFFANGLSSPTVTEYTLSVGGQVHKDIAAAITYVHRNTKDFVEDFITHDTGATDVVFQGVDYGTFDNVVYQNTNALKRNYEALLFQAKASLTKQWRSEINYTYTFKFNGNFEGEAGNNPAISTVFGNYPEILALDRQLPEGRLNEFQKHKLRFLNSYDVPTTFGNFVFGAVYNFDSGTPYSFAATVPYSDIQLARGTGYQHLPQTETIYFGGRGTELFPSASSLDLALNYDIPVWKSVSPWLKFTIYNVFNGHYLTFDPVSGGSFNTTVIPCTDPTDAKQAGCTSFAKDANGLPVNFVKGGQFGKATSNAEFIGARRFNISVGIRF